MYLQTIIPEHVTSRELAHVVRLLGIRLIAKSDGGVVGIPVRPERSGAKGSPRIRRRHAQKPTGPDAA